MNHIILLIAQAKISTHHKLVPHAEKHYIKLTLETENTTQIETDFESVQQGV